MPVTYTDSGELRTIVISGRVIVGGSDSEATKLFDLAQESRRVVIDLSPVTMLASIGIRALVAAAKKIGEQGGKMVLVVAPGTSVLKAIETAGVNQLVPVFASAKEAEQAAIA